MRLREKNCDHCQVKSLVLYRVQFGLGWVFLCGICRRNAELEHSNYTYGGTWKASKRQ